jgi:hypothetical protein
MIYAAFNESDQIWERGDIVKNIFSDNTCRNTTAFTVLNNLTRFTLYSAERTILGCNVEST